MDITQVLGFVAVVLIYTVNITGKVLNGTILEDWWVVSPHWNSWRKNMSI